MSRDAPAHHPINELIAARWSPRAFEPAFVPGSEDIARLFEAARWAASSSNLQPWAYVYGQRGSGGFAAILATLVPFNAGWAQHASVLAIGIAQTVRDDGKPNGSAHYDLGQATANLALQAADQGLAVHQMGGFDPARAAELLGIPEGHVAAVAIAIGKAGAPELLGDERLVAREVAPRERKPVSAFAFEGRWKK